MWVRLGPRPPRDDFRHPPDTGRKSDLMHRDWAYPIGGTAIGSFPAKYNFDINAGPSCSDFVVFPENSYGSTTQANIIGFNNLYDGTCPSSAGTGLPFAPSVQFAYYVDVGYMLSSPTLSEDGSKIAFVTYNSLKGMTFHMLTLSTTGSNGTAYNAPVAPCTVNGVQSCTTNNAVDTSFVVSTSTNSNYPVSSPFVDYSGDIAYIGDEAGNLHKITGVFRGTPSEITTAGWPFAVESGSSLSSPVYDSVSQHIFGVTNNANLYCIDASSGTPAFCNPSGKISVGSQGTVWEGPIVDSTAGTVFAEGVNTSGSNFTPILTQATTSLAGVVQASMGSGDDSLFDGDFDNTYYSGNYASGYMYFCGANGYLIPALFRIGFNSNGTMNNATDGNLYPLGNQQAACTPLTEAYNPGQGKDYLFLGVGYPSTPAGCHGEVCILSFELGSSFPSGPAATLPLGSGYNVPISGIVIDNVSSVPGTSQIYFSNGFSGSATQATQNGLN
jgi:hypothetical protein